ncbi:MAG: hypothetical protein JJD96_06465 [Thermoleophilia bacterium]|nr:hypothetical protein [Thermoleophilia bacterium]
MVVQVVDAARARVDAVVGNDRLGLVPGQVDTIADEGDLASRLPTFCRWAELRFPRVSHFAQVVEERRDQQG